jgi:beta-barrel assembly-enhancing protease
MNIKIFNPIMSLLWKAKKRLVYGIMGFVMAISFSFGLAQVAYSFSLWDLLIPAIQVFQLSNLSDSQEVDLGKQINAEISRQVPISRNRQLTNYVAEIGQKLAKTSSRSNIPYVFQVVADNDINAFATMGGFVYIQEGLIRASKNEAELASVMGHEIAHIAAKHSVKQMRQQALTQGVLTAAGLNQSAAVQIGVQLALQLPNSRGDELEADQLGLDNVTRACYDPSGMVSFMRTLEQGGNGRVPTFISSHPSPNNRVSLLQQRINTNAQTPSITSYVQTNCQGQNNGLDPQLYHNRLRSVGINI